MAVDYFLKIEGVPGESPKKEHKDEIELQAWSWGEMNSGSAAASGGGGAGKVSMQDFNFTMIINKASPKLFLYCATGKHIPEAVLTCREAGGKQEPYLKIKFTDLIISSYQTGGSQGEIKPSENISFNFARIDFSYAPQKSDGTLDTPETHWFSAKEMDFA